MSQATSTRARPPSTAARVGGWVVLVAYLGVVAAVTLTPLPGALEDQTANFVPGASFSRYLAEGIDPALAVRQLGGNIAMFLPFGFVLPFAIPATRSLALMVPLAALTSLGIEIAQAEMVEGRVFDIDDVVLNLIGATVGVLIHKAVRR